jgi:hypothetical protein
MPKLAVGITQNDAGLTDVAFILGPFPEGTVIQRLAGAFDTPAGADTAANRCVSLSLALSRTSPGNVLADVLTAISQGEALVAAPIQSGANAQAVMDGQPTIGLPAMGAVDLPLGVTLEYPAYLLGHAVSGLPGPIAGDSSVNGALGVDVLWPDEESETGFSQSQLGLNSPTKPKTAPKSSKGVPHPPVRPPSAQPIQSGTQPTPQPTAPFGR